MKMSKALKIIEEGIEPEGFMVHFEWKKDGFLRSDYFPDKHAGEILIKTEKEAWILAREFSKKTKGKSVNLYVIDQTFHPVSGYRSKYIKNR